MNEITSDEIKLAVTQALRGYPWGGEVLNIHKNQWDEWIADCHIWGQYGTSPSDPDWHYYSEGDTDCPIRQLMVEIDKDPYRFNLGYPSVFVWEAKDDKRLPTFIEEGGTMLDPYVPQSPYIVEPIKEYLAKHKNDKPIF